MVWLNQTMAALAVMTTATTAAIQPEIAQTLAADVLVDAEILELERERFERYTVPVSIGDRGPYRFMIDTGAQATVLATQIADELALLDRRPATLIGMASTKPVEVVTVADLTLGSRSFDILTAPLVSRENIGAADGILGLDSLQNQRVLLNFAEQTISVADAEEAYTNRGYEIIVRARRKLGQLVIARAQIDGVRVAVIVDTGAQGSMGNLALEQKLRTRAIGQSQMTDINGTQVNNDLRLARNLQIGRAQLSNVPMSFADSPPFQALGLQNEPAMVLGMRELRLFKRVAIDFKERTVLFDLPDDARRAPAGVSSRINR